MLPNKNLEKNDRRMEFNEILMFGYREMIFCFRHRPGGFAPRADPVVIHETETSKTAAHVVNIPYKTMHVMADLTPEGKLVLLTVQVQL